MNTPTKDQAPEAMTDEQIAEMARQEQFLLVCDDIETLTAIVRAVEQHHSERLRAQPAGLAEVQLLRDYLREAVDFQSTGKSPTIHDYGRWRRLLDRVALPTQPAGQAPATSPDDLIRVAVFGLGACALYAKYEHVQHEVESHLDDGAPVPGDSETYTLTFKTITRAEFDAMGEFDGF